MQIYVHMNLCTEGWGPQYPGQSGRGVGHNILGSLEGVWGHNILGSPGGVWGHNILSSQEGVWDHNILGSLEGVWGSQHPR